MHRVVEMESLLELGYLFLAHLVGEIDADRGATDASQGEDDDRRPYDQDRQDHEPAEDIVTDLHLTSLLDSTA